MRVYKSTPLQNSSFLTGPKKYQIRRFQGISEREKDLDTEETLDPKLIRMMKENSEVVFARSNTDTPLLDFAKKKPENFTDILDFRLGKYYSFLYVSFNFPCSDRMLQFRKYFAKFFGRAFAALENEEEDKIFKSLIMELFGKSKAKKIVKRRKKSLNILLISSWSSGKDLLIL